MLKAAVRLALTLGVSSAAFAGHAAEWVTHPETRGEAGQQPVDLQFQQVLQVDRTPRRLPVRVTADNRFVLYVNGRRVAAGPSRGDLAHWRAATVDLAPYLRRGENVIAAEVWNDGGNKPGAQISARTGFRLEAADTAWAPRLDTGQAEWRVRRDDSRTVGRGLMQVIRAVGPTGYYIAGGPETLEGRSDADAWLTQAGTQAGWTAPAPALDPGEAPPWTLVADALPPMRYEATPIGRVVRARGVEASRFPDAPLVIPANTEAEILIDTGRVLAAYPSFRLAGGQGATVDVTYAEALYDAQRRRLTDRSAVGDGQMLGLTDTLKPSGETQTLRPRWWRAWRFLQLKVKTGDQPLTLAGVDAHETGYPFRTLARFDSDDAQLNEIWRIGWNTVRFDAHETYMDTAYWSNCSISAIRASRPWSATTCPVIRACLSRPSTPSMRRGWWTACHRRPGRRTAPTPSRRSRFFGSA